MKKLDKFNISATIKLTFSKIMGGITILGGLYGFCTSKDATQSAFIIGIGASLIIGKQYFQSKNFKNGNDTEASGESVG